MLKTCNKCGKEKPLKSEYFHRNKRSPNGFRNECKDCMSKHYKKYYKSVKEKKTKYNKRWREKNKEDISEYNKRYREDNKEELKQRYESNKEKLARKGKIYRKENKDKLNQYFQKRRQEDVQYKLKCNLRTRLHHAIKDGSKSSSTLELLGCSVETLKQHLENQFKTGMHWDNYGVNGWHIDHIKPCASFDLSDVKQQSECFHYTNLQPLWADENIRKSDKINYEIKSS